MNSVALVLAVLAILVFVLILQQQQLAPQQPQSNKVVYVQPNDITPIWWGGQGPSWGGPLPGGRPWNRWRGRGRGRGRHRRFRL